MFRSLVALLLLVSAVSTGSAQSELGGAQSGAVGLHALPDPPSFGASGNTELLRHRSPIGSPCLTVSGLARRRAVTPNVFDHVVTIKNTCAQRISLKVCYYKSQDCIPVEVPGGERKEAVLGSMPAAREFRFEFREKF